MNSYIRQQDSKGQNVQNGSPINVLKDITDLDSNDREIPHLFLRKKAEKLATAVYVVTGFLSDNEPIKWQIRESGLSILSDVVSVADSRMSEMAHRVKSVTSGIGKITSLFEIAAAAGFVSGMNLSILKEEYRALVDVIENRKIGKPEGGYIFSREFFENREEAHEPEHSFLTEKERVAPNNFYKGQPFPKAEQAYSQGVVSDIISKNIPSKTGGKSSRRETILHLMKDKGEAAGLSIKDIVGRFSDCGEKTIQRELTALVEEGVLKKTGERRWSRYSLK